MDKTGITITFGGQEIHMECAMIGGIVNEKESEMMGVYCGKRDIGDLGVAMMQAMRGCFKTARQEFGLDIEKAVEFMTYTLQEAITREIKHGHSNETVYRQIRKR
jgi:hypothetical protein